MAGTALPPRTKPVKKVGPASCWLKWELRADGAVVTYSVCMSLYSQKEAFRSYRMIIIPKVYSKIFQSLDRIWCPLPQMTQSIKNDDECSTFYGGFPAKRFLLDMCLQLLNLYRYLLKLVKRLAFAWFDVYQLHRQFLVSLILVLKM